MRAPRRANAAFAPAERKGYAGVALYAKPQACFATGFGHPEFDAWRWANFWVPLESVIEFKRGVYRLALNELADILFQGDMQTRPKSYRLEEGGGAS